MMNWDEAKKEEIEGGKEGIARELARINLNLSYYTQFYWKINLHNLLHFLSLRADSHAQYEIRVYAQKILHEIVKVWVPCVYEAFMDYRMNGVNLSQSEHELLQKAMKKGGKLSHDKDLMTQREWDEFIKKFPDL